LELQNRARSRLRFDIKIFSAEQAGNHFPARQQFPVLKLYAYQGCSTCRNAVKWLQQQGIPFAEIAIREQPPTTLELEAALKSRGGDLGALFNRSGLDYRALGMKDKLPAMSQSEALQLLSKNGNLVKRPFAIDEKKRVVLVGFKEPEWESALA
jgi:arsenate reductase